MKGAVIIMGNVSAQMVNIKKVAIDSDRKVGVTIEFLATDEKARENVFKLIDLQGDMAEMTVRPAQEELFEGSRKGRDQEMKGGNGKKIEESEFEHVGA